MGAGLTLTVPFPDVDALLSSVLISKCSNKTSASPSNLNIRVQLEVKSLTMRIPIKNIFFLKKKKGKFALTVLLKWSEGDNYRKKKTLIKNTSSLLNRSNFIGFKQ